MATETVTALDELTSPAANDEIGIWDVSAAQYMRITRANLVGGTITGGGTVATGGFTLTVPATGTANLIGTAQTISALKTFSAGISFGNETLAAYDVGTWTPDLRIGGLNTGITYSTQVGDYVRIGAMCFVRFEITLSSKGALTGTVDIYGLPVAAATVNRGGLVLEYGANLASVTTPIYARLASTTARITAAYADLTQANLNNNSVIRMWGVYQV